MLLSRSLMLQVSNEEELKVYLDQFHSSIDHDQAGGLKSIPAEVSSNDSVAGVEEDTSSSDDQKNIMLVLSLDET